MSRFQPKTPADARQRLVEHVQQLEWLEEEKRQAAERLKSAFDMAKLEGYDTTTLKVVLKLRKMTPEQRREKKALEAIYLAALGMLEGDPLTDEARRRLDPEPEVEPKREEGETPDSPARRPRSTRPEPPAPPAQPTLALKEPDEARAEGEAAAAAGKRIYDNPYPAGDPCRAAWDEGWCAKSRSHGMDTPSAYQRRTTKAPEKDDKDKRDERDGDVDKKDVA